VIAVLLYLAMFFDARPTVTEVRCDRLELNHCYDVSREAAKPKLVERFAQWIAWDFCAKHNEMHVADWIMAKQAQYLGLDGQNYRILVSRSGGFVIVAAPVCLETWTMNDPEVDDQAKLPTAQRRKIFGGRQ